MWASIYTSPVCPLTVYVPSIPLALELLVFRANGQIPHRSKVKPGKEEEEKEAGRKAGWLAREPDASYCFLPSLSN